MQKGQGALEYLIIITAVLAISAVIVLFLTGALGGQSNSAQFSACKNAAVACKNSKLLSPNDPCFICDTSCVDLQGNDLITGTKTFEAGSAVAYCKAGQPEQIYKRSAGNCSDGTLYNQCSVTKPKYCSAGTLIDRCTVCGCATGGTCNTTSNSCYTFVPTYDFTLSSSDISLSKVPYVGDTITVTITIHNNGNTNATNVIVSYSQCIPSLCLAPVEKTIAFVPAGGTGSTSFSWTLNDIGLYSVVVWADSPNAFAETNELNNEATKEFDVGYSIGPPPGPGPS